MSSDTQRPESENDSATVPDERFRLETELEILREENANLRREYARVHRVRNRNAAVGLVAVGLVALVGAAILPSVRTILLVLGATGLFTATLVYYLEPTRMIPASVGEAVYSALAANESALVAELGLDASPAYFPTEAPGTPVVLFVAQDGDERPLPESDSLFVISNETDAHGVALRPCGVPLLESFRRSIPDASDETPSDLVGGLADAVEALGMVDAASYTVDVEANHLTVGVSGHAYGNLDRFDHPVVSFFAVGLADTLDEPVRVESVEPSDRADAVVEYRWGE